MSRPMLFAAGALLALTAAAIAFRGLARPATQEYRPDFPASVRAVPVGVAVPRVAPAPGSEAYLSRAGRERVREFWDAYRSATAEKQAGRWQAAIAGYRRALALNPDHWDSLYYLGNALMEQRRYPEAERAYRRLVASDNQAARAYSALGGLYSNPNAGALFDLARAEQEFQRARRANADESGSVLRLGEVAMAAGQVARAREYLAAAGRTNFKSVNAPLLLGYLAWKQHDASRALDLFAQAVAQTKTAPPPAGVLGEGDTSLPGYQAMVRPGQHGLFDAFAADLWRKPDAGADHMARLYGELDRFLAGLPARHPSG